MHTGGFRGSWPRFAVLVLSILFVACSTTGFSNKTALRVLWTYPTELSDMGYTFALDRARSQLEDQYNQNGTDVESNGIENVREDNCVELVTNALAVGWKGHPYDLWISTGVQQIACAIELAQDEEWAGLKIVVTQVPPTQFPDLGVALVGTHESRFLQGMLCAMASRSGTIGFVAASPQMSAPVARPTAAFYLGAKFANPAVRVVLGTTGTFLFPLAERKATEILIRSANADCVGSHQNDNTVQFTAEAHNIYSVGFASDARYFAGESVLVSAVFSWDKVLHKYYEYILNDSWPAYDPTTPQIFSGSLTLSAFSTKVTPEWRRRVWAAADRLQNGTLGVYCTPHLTDPKWMNANSSYEASPGVFCLTHDALLRMTGIVEGMELLIAYNDSHTPYVIKYVKWDSATSVILLSLASLLVLLSIGSAIDVLLHLSHPIISASSPLFLFLILVGIIIMSAEGFLRVGPRTTYNCMSVWWFSGIGYATIFSCLFAKNWRMWRIFTSSTIRTTKIFDYELISKIVVVALGAEVLLLSLWTVINPQVPIIRPVAISGHEDEQQQICGPKAGRSRGFQIIFGAFNCALLVPLVLISYWTRGARTEYKESRQIAIIVYTTIVVVVIVAGIFFSIPPNYRSDMYLIGYGILIIPLLVWVVLFVPKHFLLHSSLRPSSTGSSRIQSFESKPIFDSITHPSFSAPPLPAIENESDTDE